MTTVTVYTQTVSEILASAVKRKDITSLIAEQLKPNYPESNRGGLIGVLKEFARDRIKHIMQMQYKELDKNGLLEELKAKYCLGFAVKFTLNFRKPYNESEKPDNSKSDGRLLLDLLFSNGLIDKETYEGDIKSFTGDDAGLYSRAVKRVDNIKKCFESSSYDELKEDQLATMKQWCCSEFFYTYLEKYGTEYSPLKK